MPVRCRTRRRRIVCWRAPSPFGLYQDAGYATPWGNTQGANTLSDSGTGAVKVHTVYGQATLSATMPAPDVYSSTVTATVYF